MTVQDAVDKVRKIQKDLDEGRPRVPYPREVRETLDRCLGVFSAHATSVEKAREIVERLEAPEPETADLW